MSNRITDTEYAHYALTYAAAKMSAPLPSHGTPREAVLGALAVDDAKSILGVLPCMVAGDDGRKSVDLHDVEANGRKILALYYPRGYNVQEILDGAREMAKSAHMQDIDSVSAQLHSALTGEPYVNHQANSKKIDLSVTRDNTQAEIVEEVYARVLKNRLFAPKDPQQVAEEVCSHIAGALERMSKKS